MDMGRRLFLVPGFFWLILAPALVTGLGLAENVDPDSDGSQYAWGENVGWISAEMDVDGDGTPDVGVHVEDFRLTGWMWGENVGWISLSCLTTETCPEVPYFSNNDGHGVLRGWAWGENVGWISLSCVTTESCDHVPYGVTVDVTTGEFGGHAWGENIGWINFAFEEPSAEPYRIKTGWNCDPPPAPPAGAPELLLAKVGEDLHLTWTTPPGATGFDLVLGDLILLGDGGDFQISTLQCVRGDYPADSVTLPGWADPGAAEWFLVRPVNCGGDGSYDDWGGSQVGSRDPGIQTSGHDCY